jgi:hypothetical protein
MARWERHDQGIGVVNVMSGVARGAGMAAVGAGNVMFRGAGNDRLLAGGVGNSRSGEEGDDFLAAAEGATFNGAGPATTR